MNKNFETTEEYAAIKSKLFDYLGRQDYSERKLLQKVTDLKKNYPNYKKYSGYTITNVHYVIERLKELGIIDEIRFLENMVRQSLSSIYGMQRIEQKMYTRLYHKDNITSVIQNYKNETPERDYTRIIRATQTRKNTLENKYKDTDKIKTVHNRLVQFLAAKGFNYDEIKMIIEKAR